MKELPKPEIYDSFFKNTPWGLLIKEIVSIIHRNSFPNATILDLMCGTGYLLNEVQKERKDLILEGIDLSDENISYAEKNYPSIKFQKANALTWTTDQKFDIILCTGGLHHIQDDEKQPFVKKISQLIQSNGFAIIADPYIDNYSNEVERKNAAARLGYEYLIYAIENNASDKSVEATLDILYNDVLHYEFKTSIKKIEPLLKQCFQSFDIKKTWQTNDAEFGDYYIICKV